MVIAACIVAALVQAGTRVGPSAVHAGRVLFVDLPVPGATIVATRGEQRMITVSGESGEYRFEGLAPGTWNMTVEMPGFQTLSREITIPESTPTRWELSALSIDEILAAGSRLPPQSLGQPATAPTPPPAASTAATPPPAASTAATPLPAAPTAAAATAPLSDPPSDQGLAAGGFIINGTVNNAAASPFSQPAAFGNNRRTAGARYNGSLGTVIGSSAFDARPYSFAGRTVARPLYTDVQIVGVLGGPLNLPGIQSSPTFFAAYQLRLDHYARTRTAIVPTAAERSGDLSSSQDERGAPIQITDPVSGLPFAGGIIPDARVSPQARALAALYPLPNLEGETPYNYEHTSLSDVRQHSMQSRVTHRINPQHLLTANVTFQRTANDTTTLLGFAEENRSTLWDVTATWIQRFTRRFSARYRYQWTQQAARVLPEFAFRSNVSGDAGIAGNAQDPPNWGPPNLLFSRGTADLLVSEYQQIRDTTHAAGFEGYYNRGRHNLTFGGEWRPRLLDVFEQHLGRGAFSFTGLFTGYDFADFLLGVPSEASIAVADAETRLRGSSAALYVADDIRPSPELSVNVGVRWELESPFHERSNRLVNLDVRHDFSAVAPVRAGTREARLSGTRLGSSLLDSEWRGVQPRLAITWRPPRGRSLVVRAGYGVYRTTGIYPQIARLLAQQPPVAKAFNRANASLDPATMATVLVQEGAPFGTFGVDPNFHQGYAHTWQTSGQRNLPGSLTATFTYTASIGRSLPQQILPNTYPPGGVDPCPTCPAGFVYLRSGGSSSRHAGQVQLRRRLRGGWTAAVQYTLARAVDDASTFAAAGPAFIGPGSSTTLENSGRQRYGLDGATVAQDWREPDAERGPSPFDQRHHLLMQGQYTTGIGRASGSNRAVTRLFSGWTVSAQMTTGSGLPFTPIYPVRIGDTGFVGIRPSGTGASVDDIRSGLYLNPNAFGAPSPGAWGDVDRNSARGPRPFAADASVARSFSRGDRVTLEWRLDATNVLNRVTYVGVGTIVGTPLFGYPVAAAPMRKLQTTIRLRF